MPAIVQAGVREQRRRRAPEVTQAWAELLAGTVVLAGAAALTWSADELPLSHAVLLWGVLLVAIAVLLRRGWIKLFGPVLFYDLVRTGRRGRYVLLRCLYGLGLLLLLVGAYFIALLERPMPLYEALLTPLTSQDISLFAERFFCVFLVLQMLAVVLLTPAYTAGVLAEERERQTLDALFATDLRGREIVLGLFVSRLANLALFTLAGLPVLSALQFLGGVEPGLVLAGFAFTGLTMLSLAGLSILQSLLASKPREAVIRTYLIVAVYGIVSTVGSVLALMPIGLAGFPSTPTWNSPITFQDVTDWLSIGNPVIVAVQLGRGIYAGGRFDDLLPPLLRDYGWFHGLIALCCVAWATLRLRTVALGLGATASATDRRALRQRGRLALDLRPPVGGRPMLWKEVFVENAGRRGLLGRFLTGLVLAALLLPGVHILFFYDRFWPLGPNDRLSDWLNLWLRGASLVLGSFMLLQVAIRAAVSISGERDRGTLDGLLATPLTNQRILAAKWAGSIVGPRGPWICLGLLWAMGLLTRALHPLAMLAFVAVWLVYAAFAAGLGLWFSIASRSTRTAIFATLCGVGAVLLLSVLAAHDFVDTWLTTGEALSLIPPLHLGLLVFAPADFQAVSVDAARVRPGLVLLGLVVWATATVVLWRLANVRFHVITGRAPDRDPEMPPPAESPTTVPSIVASLQGEGPSPLPPAPWLWPWRLLHLASLLLPVALLLAWYGHLRNVNERDLQAAFAEVDQLDPGWRREELEARRREVPDTENSAFQHARILALLPREYPKLEQAVHDPELRLYELPPDQQPSEEQVRRLRALLGEVPDAVAAARRLTEMPRGRFPTVYLADGVTPNLERTHQVRQVSNLLSHDATLRAHDGGIDGALASCRALLHAGRTVGDEPAFVAQLVRLAVQYQGVRQIERALAQGEASESALAALQQTLQTEDPGAALLHGLRGERALLDEHLQSIQQGRSTLSYFGGQPPQGVLRFWPLDEEILLLLAGSLNGSRALLLRYQTEIIESVKTAPEQNQATAFAPGGAIPALPRPVAMLLPSTYHMYQAVLRGQALVTTGLVAVALERYRRAHGQWPASLAELVPAYLERVPADPYDGKPVRYLRAANHVVVYTLGPNGLDDKGVLNRQNPQAPSTDLGLQLWDVASRRRPPASPGGTPKPPGVP